MVIVQEVPEVFNSFDSKYLKVQWWFDVINEVGRKVGKQAGRKVVRSGRTHCARHIRLYHMTHPQNLDDIEHAPKLVKRRKSFIELNYFFMMQLSLRFIKAKTSRIESYKI